MLSSRQKLALIGLCTILGGVAGGFIGAGLGYIGAFGSGMFIGGAGELVLSTAVFME